MISPLRSDWNKKVAATMLELGENRFRVIDWNSVTYTSRYNCRNTTLSEDVQICLNKKRWTGCRPIQLCWYADTWFCLQCGTTQFILMTFKSTAWISQHIGYGMFGGLGQWLKKGLNLSKLRSVQSNKNIMTLLMKSISLQLHVLQESINGC